MAQNFLRDALSPSLVRMQLESDTKEGVIRELIDILDRAGLLSDRAEAERVVLEREDVMSTGMEHGLAIPHGKTDTVDRLLVSMGLKPEGMDFDCMDGEPARILLLTLSPASSTGPHVRFMAEVSRLMSSGEVREQVLSAQTPEDIVEVLTQ